jgi:hypothetical protein
MLALLLLLAQDFKHPWVASIDEKKPDVVIIGNSMVGEGVDVSALSKATGAKVLELRDNGQLTAWQYMVVKNVVGSAKHVPKLVMVVERVNAFTTPRLRVGGAGKKAIDELRNGAEPVLDKIAYGGPALEKEAQGRPEFQDFHANVETSFLPHMIDVAKRKGFTLVVTRHKSRDFAENPAGADTPVVQKYRKDIAAYVSARGQVFLDYELEPALKIEHYGNGSHLNRGEGRATWTRLLAEDVKALLAGKSAPHQLK